MPSPECNFGNGRSYHSVPFKCLWKQLFLLQKYIPEMLRAMPDDFDNSDKKRDWRLWCSFSDPKELKMFKMLFLCCCSDTWEMSMREVEEKMYPSKKVYLQWFWLKVFKKLYALTCFSPPEPANLIMGIDCFSSHITDIPSIIRIHPLFFHECYGYLSLQTIPLNNFSPRQNF